MFPAMISCALFAFPADGGRVEVEGVVITAVIVPSKIRYGMAGGKSERDLELSVAAKSGGKTPICVFVGPIQAIGADNKSLLSPRRVGFESEPRTNDRDNWWMRLNFVGPPPKKVHAVEGTALITPSQRKTVTFEGATLKPNAVVAVERGQVKLTVLDLEDDRPDVRFRMSLASEASQHTPMKGARLTLVDAQGKETLLISRGLGMRGGGGTVDHIFRFDSENAFAAASLRTMRLEVPIPAGPTKKVPFQIRDVPVEE